MNVSVTKEALALLKAACILIFLKKSLIDLKKIKNFDLGLESTFGFDKSSKEGLPFFP